MPDEIGNICDLARQPCCTVGFPRQTRIATLHTRIESHLPSFCTSRGGASDATALCFVFAPEKPPRFSLSSCRIGCIARDKGSKQSDRMGLAEFFFLVVVQM